MLMAMQQCVSAHPMPPPPPAPAPKPNKDNARLRKILKRIAKQQAAEISLQPEDASDKSQSYLSKPFRACLSPVSEASPDPEHSGRRTLSPQSLQSPLSSLRQHSTILTQTHTTSLYPLRKTFYKGKIEILPKKGGQHIPAEAQNQAPGQLLQPVIPVKTFFISNVQSSSKKQSPMVAMPPRFSPSFYARPGMEMPKANISTDESIKPKDIVSEANITKLYTSGPDTAMTSAKGYVFETSRAKTPTHEPPRAKTPTYEPPRAKTPTYEPPRAKTPTYDPPRARTPTYDPPRTRTPTYEPPRVRTPTYEPPRARTPTYEPPRARTPTNEPPRARTPTYEPLRARTPTYEPPRARTPTYEPPRARTPTYDPPRTRTPTYEPPRVRTPTYEPMRVKTPTYEPPRARTPTYEPLRARTPTYEPPRVRTPTYELPKVKTPTYEPPRAKTPTNEPLRAMIPANELLSDKTFTHAVPQESLSKEGSDVSAMQSALTIGHGSANMEIHQIAKTTMEKNKVGLEPKPSNTVVETTNQDVKSFLKAAPQMKPVDRVKPPRSKISGWTRLKKHMVVEEEPPKFLEPEPELPESEEQKQNRSIVEGGKLESPKARGSRANKMWDAMLFQMFAWKEHLTEASSQNQQESALDTPRQAHQTSWFSCRLPLLLFRPRFDARKLKEAAKGPLRRISSTLIESGLHRKAIDDEELKDFNRTAKGWQTKAVT